MRIDWAAGLAVNLIPPAVGIVLFILLCRRMKRSAILSPPFLTFFVLFFCIGGWLMVGLTALFWEWSGMASLGAGFLVLVSPFLVGTMALVARSKRTTSRYHFAAVATGVAYTAIVAIIDAGLVAFYLLRRTR
ncbi:MAG TPA: hypothetical protein VGG34_08035 [Opitutaceae bacterium]|jgi:hypothetical protein